MIFGRKKHARRATEELSTAKSADPKQAKAKEPAKRAAKEELDPRDLARDWDEAFTRDEGPFDISEVDLDADEVRRLDFGALILTPFEGMQLQLNKERETDRIQSILVGDGASALEVTVFAGPTRTSMLEEIRDDITTVTQQQHGRLEFVEGPFGTELRRAIPAKDEQGNNAFHVSRTWLVAGPGWVLRGTLLGKTVLEPENEQAELSLFEFFSNLVVRRGSAPAVPGRVIHLSAPNPAG